MDNFNRSFDPLAETILLLGTFATEVPAEVEADRGGPCNVDGTCGRRYGRHERLGRVERGEG
jgi:hypothetical protein